MDAWAYAPSVRFSARGDWRRGIDLFDDPPWVDPETRPGRHQRVLAFAQGVGMAGIVLAALAAVIVVIAIVTAFVLVGGALSGASF